MSSEKDKIQLPRNQDEVKQLIRQLQFYKESLGICHHEIEALAEACEAATKRSELLRAENEKLMNTMMEIATGAGYVKGEEPGEVIQARRCIASLGEKKDE